MKIVLTALLFVLLMQTGFSKDPETKSFLVIFDKTELKQHNSSAQIIEMTFMDLFQTKSYTGNSEAALLIQIPGGTFDECQLGMVMVKLNNSKWTQLQDIAFRIIDLGDTKSNFSELLALYEGKFYKNKKQTIKVNSKL